MPPTLTLRCALSLLLACCAFAAGATPPKRPAHVVLVIEENRSFRSLIGNSEAPYINALAQQGALFVRSYAVTHPSEPNYLALFSGDTQGVTDDSCPHSYRTPQLAGALAAKQLSFAIYSEDLPEVGFTGCASDNKLYRRKHNPVPDFPAVPDTANQPFSAFPADYSKLPTVSFVVPNMMDDMHDGTAAQADAWLKRNLDAYIQWAKKNGSLLILTWDEDDGSDNNRIVTLVLGAGIKPGRYRQRIDHYDVLRTLTDMYGVTPIGHAAQAKPMTGI